MPLRLNVGVSRKIGLPEYSSAGASCNIEVELDSGLLDHDVGAFHARVRQAFEAARQAVNDELARLQDAPPITAAATPVNGHGLRNGAVAHANANGKSSRYNGTSPRTDRFLARGVKEASPNQVRAIAAIARKQDLDLERLLRDQFGVGHPEELSVSQASGLIDQLRGNVAG